MKQQQLISFKMRKLKTEHSKKLYFSQEGHRDKHKSIIDRITKIYKGKSDSSKQKNVSIQLYKKKDYSPLSEYRKDLKINLRKKQPSPAGKDSGFLSDRKFKKSPQAKQSHLSNVLSIRDFKSSMAKTPSQLQDTQKYFRKEQKQQKQAPLGQTLRSIWQKKYKKPKFAFKMLKQLGKSQTGSILLCRSNHTNMILAMKTFKKDKVKLDFLIEQAKIHLFCRHPHILPAYGFHVAKQEIFLMMESAECNLYQRIIKNGLFSERKTANYIFQVASAVQYLHELGVIHRDIKPENILCIGQTLKLADFGWSTITNGYRKTLCGTMDYLSPEVVNREPYSNKVDCWSIGVLMYQMLTGQPPFHQQKKSNQFKQFNIPKKLSTSGRNLLLNLLETNSVDRMSAKDVLKHQWIRFHTQNKDKQQKNEWKILNKEVDKLF